MAGQEWSEKLQAEVIGVSVGWSGQSSCRWKWSSVGS